MTLLSGVAAAVKVQQSVFILEQFICYLTDLVARKTDRGRDVADGIWLMVNISRVLNYSDFSQNSRAI
jgi:hypothetical protein